MFRIARLSTLGLLVAAAISGCTDTPSSPSTLDASGSVAARSASVGTMDGTWIGTVGVDGAATAALLQVGSRISGGLDVTTAGVLKHYAVEGLENKGKVYLNLFDGVNLPEPLIGVVSNGKFKGTLDGSTAVSLDKK